MKEDEILQQAELEMSRRNKRYCDVAWLAEHPYDSEETKQALLQLEQQGKIYVTDRGPRNIISLFELA
ncbi:hypothetical protein [Mixta calida]|uniref:hypothetical protein n=1 Tax=Mixta calida TaxID=665913 RepID=UPI0028A9FEE1|nr:hypothetical protein [Mixta calida]